MRKSSEGDLTDLVRKSYSLAELPEKYHKKYRHVAKFVDLVRSSAPKIQQISRENMDLTAEGDSLAGLSGIATTTTTLHPCSVPLQPEKVNGASFEKLAEKSGNDSGFGQSPASSVTSSLSAPLPPQLGLPSEEQRPGQPQPSAEKPKFVFIREVGWCFKTEAGDYQVLFVDGARLTIEAKGTLVWFTGGDGVETAHQLNKQMPKEVRARLAAFPEFMALLKKV